MSWQDELQEASFRGVKFHVEGHDSIVGRRNAIHEYPLRDLPYVEDMGRRIREFDISAFVIGPSYFNDRDDLLTACEEAGPGKLVHPYLGERTVACIECRVVEDHREGGMARFVLRFVEAGQQATPTTTADTQARVRNSAASLLSQAATSFEAVFDAVGSMDFITTIAGGQLTEALDAIEELGGYVSDATAFGEKLAAMRAGSSSLLADPATLAADLGTLAGYATDIDALVPVLDFDYAYPDSPFVTSARTTLAANETALNALTRHSGLAQAAKVAAGRTFETYDQAVAVREDLADRLSEEAEGTTDDDLFVALLRLRTDLVADITSRAANLPRLEAVTLPEIEPSLVTAYRLYGDAEREREIADRNGIAHPGFLPAGQDLLVLNQ